MAVALELDPEQIACRADKTGGAYDRSPASPLELHPAAMRAACDLIDRLYQNGLLDLLRAMASSSGDIAGKLAEGADTGEFVRVIRNGMTLLSVLGNIDPATLQRMASAPRDAQAAGAKARDEEDAEPPGMWALFRRFSSPEGRRGLALMADVVESIGRAAKESENKQSFKNGS